MLLEKAINDIKCNKSFLALERCLAEIKSRHPDGAGLKFVVCDDIDFDGVTIAYILVRQLKLLFPLAKVSVFNNDKHGIYYSDIRQFSDNSIIFIGDSSTNLITEYSIINTQVVVIDHHEVTIDVEDVCPSNVILLNSKMIPGLESVSAGAFAYLICSASEWLNIENEATLKMSVASCYSDIVPADGLVQELIDLSLDDDQDDIICKLNVYSHPITKTTLQYSIIPTVNYSRRLQDTNVLKSIIMGRLNPIIIDRLLSNKTTAMRLLRHMEEIAPDYRLTDYKNILLYDITDMRKDLALSVYPYENFKGVLANRLADKFKLPVVVGYMKDTNTFYTSFRSPNLDTLTFLNQFNLVGGGHKPACGFEIPIDEFYKIFSAYDSYCKEQKVDMSKFEFTTVQYVDDIASYPLWELAMENEYAYSDKRIKAFVVDHLLTNIQQTRDTEGGFIYNDIHFRSTDPIEANTPYILVPTLTAYKLQRFVIQIIKYER